MSVIGVFARPSARHSGYVVVMVECDDEVQLDSVHSLLAEEGFEAPFDHPDSGTMDLIATVYGGIPTLGYLARRRSVGDNRYVGIYKAHELLGHLE